MTSPSHFDRFLSEAIAVDREAGAGLGPDALYGLYTSWCLMTDAHTATARALFKALKDRHGISSSNNGPSHDRSRRAQLHSGQRTECHLGRHRNHVPRKRAEQRQGGA